MALGVLVGMDGLALIADIDGSPLRVAPLAEDGNPERGYILARGLVEPGLVAALQEEVIAACIEWNWLARGERRSMGRYDEPRWIALQQRVAAGNALAAIANHAAIRDRLTRDVGGPAWPVPASTCRIFSFASRRLTTAAHQDRFYLRTAPSFWIAWLPLVRCPLSLGPLALLEGSHTWGLLPHRPVSDGPGRAGVEVDPGAVWRSTHFRPGDVLMFSDHTVHRALPLRRRGGLRISADVRWIVGDSS